MRREIKDFCQEVDTHHFPAITDVKKSSDNIDPYYIHKINSKNINNSDDYVMKSSKTMLEMALKMDQNGGDNLMKDIDAFFDGYCHTQINGICQM